MSKNIAKQIVWYNKFLIKISIHIDMMDDVISRNSDN